LRVDEIHSYGRVCSYGLRDSSVSSITLSRPICSQIYKWISSGIKLYIFRGKSAYMASDSSRARAVGSWLRIALRAWKFSVCVHLCCVCVVLCIGSGLATGWSLVQGVLPPVKIDYGNWIRGQGPEYAGRTVERKSLFTWTLCLNDLGWMSPLPLTNRRALGPIQLMLGAGR
jgi:hypothetical protein